MADSGHCHCLYLVSIKEGDESQGNSGVSPGFTASKWYLDLQHLHFSLKKYLSSICLSSHVVLPSWPCQGGMCILWFFVHLLGPCLGHPTLSQIYSGVGAQLPCLEVQKNCSEFPAEILDLSLTKALNPWNHSWGQLGLFLTSPPWRAPQGLNTSTTHLHVIFCP